MDKLYKGYIRQHVRRMIAEGDIPLERAIDFLKENPKTGIVTDGTREISLEELENAKNFRSPDKPGLDNPASGGEPVSEDSDRELLELARGDTE